ncbi:glycosyltransferase family 2 protein, partial [bacterium]|nr:glycosyltransferase family 2 protein [bacterium]
KYSGWIFERCLPLCIVSPSSVLMRKEFFERVGLFDEDLPACEDYDLWLRGSLCFSFDFIPKPLITKRGGHWDQLSVQWGLDVYRVRALRNLLNSDRLTAEQRLMVLNEAEKKCRILIQGFRKRGKESEAKHYGKVVEKLRAKPTPKLNF